MDKSKDNVRNYAVLVKDILESTPRTRDDDYALYIAVMERCGISSNLPTITVFSAIKAKHIPPFETISRARRKAQQLYPHLRGELWKERYEKQTEYVDFAKDERI